MAQALQRQLRPERRLARGLRRHPVWMGVVVALLAGVLALGAHHSANQPPRSQAAYEQGWRAFRAKDYRQAVVHFNDAMTQGASDVQCLDARGRAFQRLGDTNAEFFGHAIADYREALRRAPHGKYAAAIGYCAHRLQQPQTAKLYYEEALKQGFATPALHHNLGCLYKALEDFKEAESHFEQALALDEHAALTHCQMADLLHALYLRDEKGKEEATDATAPMPESLRRALNHLKRGLPDVKNAPAKQAEQLARIFALTVPFESAQAENALTWLERAVASGSPVSVCRDPIFDLLASHPRHAALLLRPPSSPHANVAWVPILDPLDE